jgi:hypothetical protein
MGEGRRQSGNINACVLQQTDWLQQQQRHQQTAPPATPPRSHLIPSPVPYRATRSLIQGLAQSEALTSWMLLPIAGGGAGHSVGWLVGQLVAWLIGPSGKAHTATLWWWAGAAVSQQR